jgi:hypothetical protein
VSTLTQTSLAGARWSSAVRCIARAEFQALGIKGDEHAQSYLADAFVRGVNAAEVWLASQKVLTESLGKNLVSEAEVPWGPGGIWTGHADALIMEDHVVIEAYHSVDGKFRDEKALQAAGYALRLGDDWRAMLAALDTTEVDEDLGFAVTMYPVDAHGLKHRVEEIEERVTAAYEAGRVNPDDKVGSDPWHRECQSCPFRDPCWAGWQRPSPVDVPGATDDFLKLASLHSKRAHEKAALDATELEIDEVRDRLRPLIPPAIPTTAGGVEIKRTLIAPRVTFRLSGYLAAGHVPSLEMEAFTNHSEKYGERWKISDGTLE